MRINYDKGGLISPLRAKSQTTFEFTQVQGNGPRSCWFSLPIGIPLNPILSLANVNGVSCVRLGMTLCKKT